MSKADLQKVGLKVTNPRIKILEMLARQPHRHMSAEEMYVELQQQGDEIGIATVYRVLMHLEKNELVIKHNFGDDKAAVYELNEGVHHDHLICMKCNKLIEFLDPIIEERQTEIAKFYNFKIIDHAMTIYGICLACEDGLKK